MRNKLVLHGDVAAETHSVNIRSKTTWNSPIFSWSNCLYKNICI